MTRSDLANFTTSRNAAGTAALLFDAKERGRPGRFRI